VTGIGLIDTVTGEERTLDVQGVFVAIGADPRHPPWCTACSS